MARKKVNCLPRNERTHISLILRYQTVLGVAMTELFKEGKIALDYVNEHDLCRIVHKIEDMIWNARLHRSTKKRKSASDAVKEARDIWQLKVEV